jgi:hypothetical protein
MSNMKEYEAIELAIESMEYRRALCERQAHLYQEHGEQIDAPGERADARFAALLYIRLTHAIDLLKAKL